MYEAYIYIIYNLLLYEFVKKYERRFVTKIQKYTINFTKNEESVFVSSVHKFMKFVIKNKKL